ncbi:carbamoyltransferase HypF [Methanofollis aquaemaris]|uniref:Carbamoyltransferase n=1 Tax=Methanofollis aquaemaris TaxID=126734 RepID=A0A8A3S533_9EURY|nr:carbamoyltransferase HypF [Methanofollis aquaemaris]QSZ66969.1 carbamoyltransferase HypF [Methanofollis aquaemaris]
MQNRGKIIIRGIVQGVGFRPFVYALAEKYDISGWVKNLGSRVEIAASGARFSEFCQAVAGGTPLSVIDSVEVLPLDEEAAEPGFVIKPSGTGTLDGLITPDVAVCDECIRDIFTPGGRYENYWATSCVNCGPRYSIIRSLPYDRERTAMEEFPMCDACGAEYTDPGCRRHHAQTIACDACGPGLALFDTEGKACGGDDPVGAAAAMLDAGAVLAIRGVGGFHLACTEEAAGTLKARLGRPEQPLAVMMKEDVVERYVEPMAWDREALTSRVRPIVVMKKREAAANPGLSSLHTLGVMLPYTGLHHLLFARLDHDLLVMTSANVPGTPMITATPDALARLGGTVDGFLVHDREIVNRCDDSVVRDGHIIRLSRGIAPKRLQIDLGERCILGVGPELNATTTIYRHGFAVTSPHVGNVRNPQTLAYLQETVEKIGGLLGAEFEVIAHDLHPQFLSTRYARTLAEECGAELVAVQHHRAHIAATTREECVGIAIDGVGYGDDGTIWGGEIFAGAAPHLERTAHLESVGMPGGDLATKFPERMLYGILPEERTLDLLASRGWGETERGVLARQVERGFNVAQTSSTGRVLDAASALLGICRERTYDGEPAMKLEAVAAGGTPQTWDLSFGRDGACEILETSALLATAFDAYESGTKVADVAASVQYNLARGVADLAVRTAHERGIKRVALSGGVAYNQQIRETIRSVVEGEGLDLVVSREYPLGDGCISLGQCVWAGALLAER